MNAAPGARTSPSPYSWYVLVVLLLAYILNFVDRQVLAIVAPEVKAEMDLSDFQLGLLLGPAFAAFFTVAGLVIARVADRASRRVVLTVGLAVWSAMTAACGFVHSYTQLLFFRFAVGAGEAAGTPPSHAMISDYFPPERRATALALYGLGIYFGTGFGFAGGGLMLQWFDWRSAFIFAGLAGLPVLLLVALTVREPARASAPVPATSRASGWASIASLFRIASFRWLMTAAACQAFLGFTVLSWTSIYLRRVFALSPAEAGVSFGVIAALAGGAGTLLGGVLVDRLALRDARWFGWLSAAVSLAAFPFCVGFALAPDAKLALAAFGAFYFFNNAYTPSLWTLVQGLARPDQRATASATQLAVTNLIGYGLGPPLVGLLNDSLAAAHGDAAIRYSLLVVAAVGASSALFFWRCARTLREDLAAVAAGR